MSLPRDRLAQVKLLEPKAKSRPKQASLRRSVSAAYYALLHLLVDATARRLVSGAGRQPLRDCLARAFDHGVMKRVARQFAERNLSPRLSPGLNGLALHGEIVRVTAAFIDLQQHRHDADYNMGRQFTRIDALNIVSAAERAFVDWRAVAQFGAGRHVPRRLVDLREDPSLIAREAVVVRLVRAGAGPSRALSEFAG